MISRLGRLVLDSRQNMGRLAGLINQTAYWLVIGPFLPKGLRWRWTIHQVVQTGLQAVPIVTLISGAIGIILALQAAYQLRRVGASMTVDEEVDALRTMGLHPVKFLVVPKTLGLIIALPCLTLIADLVAISGGFAVGVWGLGLGFSAYYHQTLIFLEVADVVTGLIKSVFFALIIALVGCYQGFSVSGGAEGVGRRTTASVVTAIFLVILADAFFTLLNYLVG